MANAISVSGFARDWRNRYLAHRDLALALGRAQPLEDASRHLVRVAIAAVADVLNAIQGHYLQSTTYYGSHGGPPGGAFTLLYALDDAVRLQRARLTRLKDGNVLPEDYRPRDI